MLLVTPVISQAKMSAVNKRCIWVPDANGKNANYGSFYILYILLLSLEDLLSRISAIGKCCGELS